MTQSGSADHDTPARTSIVLANWCTTMRGFCAALISIIVAEFRVTFEGAHERCTIQICATSNQDLFNCRCICRRSHPKPEFKPLYMRAVSFVNVGDGFVQRQFGCRHASLRSYQLISSARRFLRPGETNAHSDQGQHKAHAEFLYSGITSGGHLPPSAGDRQIDKPANAVEPATQLGRVSV